WKLVYTDKKNSTMDAREKSGENIDLSFSLGFIATKQGDVRDVIPGSPAYAAGLGPGMKIIAVNGRKWSKDVVRAALRASVHSQQPLSLLAENGEYYNTYQVNYHEGERYPHLVREEGQPDMLDEMIKPLATGQ
ncbi:MAG TPA: PDZ domain-containing protein, partial [Candidatus Angelobacter sp.]|nr:PDZ domain-containing protein [Candidatus Angelobacter sp.]